jgi:hypothetical protein
MNQSREALLAARPLHSPEWAVLTLVAWEEWPSAVDAFGRLVDGPVQLATEPQLFQAAYSSCNVRTA